MNKNLKVLILEEDVLNRRLFKDLFELREVKTIVCRDRERFLEDVLGNMPSLVLFDVGEDLLNLKAIRALK